MTNFPVDDSLHSHPKAWAASLAALGLWTVAGSWSNAQASDGFVPDHVLPSLSRGQIELAKELVAAGLWKRTRGGYQFHEWAADSDGTPRNTVSSVAIATQARKSVGGKWGNHKRWHVNEGISKSDCSFCQGKDPSDHRSDNRSHTDRRTDGGSESVPNPSINQWVTAVDGDTSGQSIRAGARVREAVRHLVDAYRLTDDEAASVWSHVLERASSEIKHVVPYLKTMQRKGHLADIVAAVLDASEGRPPTPEPVLYAVPEQPLTAERTDTKPAPPTSPPMPREMAQALAHSKTCKALRCARCADIGSRWPHLRKTSP